MDSKARPRPCLSQQQGHLTGPRKEGKATSQDQMHSLGLGEQERREGEREHREGNRLLAPLTFVKQQLLQGLTPLEGFLRGGPEGQGKGHCEAPKGFGKVGSWGWVVSVSSP